MTQLLIVKPGSLGDIIHAVPVAAAIRRARPTTKILWLADVRWAPLVSAVPVVDEVVPFPRQEFRGMGGWARVPDWALNLRSLRPDCALDLQGLIRSALMGRATRPRQFFGLSDAREGARFFYDRVVRVADAEHSVMRYLRILELLEIPMPAFPEFPMPEGVRPAGLPAENFLVVAPMARGRGKSLPEPTLEALCRSLAPHPVVLVGPAAAAPALPHVVNLLGRTTLAEWVGVLRAAKAVLSVDSASAHLAVALGRPLLAIHTWTDPRKVGPFSSRARVWQGGRIGGALQAPWGPPRPPEVKDVPGLAEESLRLANGRAFEAGNQI